MTLLEFFLPKISNITSPLKAALANTALCHYSIKVGAFHVDRFDSRVVCINLGTNPECRLLAEDCLLAQPIEGPLMRVMGEWLDF